VGHPKFARRFYDKPTHPWKADRIEEENEIKSKYALKNMREIWKARSRLRRHRQHAMRLVSKSGSGDEHLSRETEQMLSSLKSRGYIPLNASLDEVLAMNVENILDRRLQTIVWIKGLASSQNQARQLVSHGHIAINEQKITVPGYTVRVEEEDDVGYYSGSPLTNDEHPLRQVIEEVRDSASFHDDNDIEETNIEIEEITQEEASELNEIEED